MLFVVLTIGPLLLIIILLLFRTCSQVQNMPGSHHGVADGHSLPALSLYSRLDHLRAQLDRCRSQIQNAKTSYDIHVNVGPLRRKLRAQMDEIPVDKRICFYRRAMALMIGILVEYLTPLVNEMVCTYEDLYQQLDMQCDSLFKESRYHLGEPLMGTETADACWSLEGSSEISPTTENLPLICRQQIVAVLGTPLTMASFCWREQAISAGVQAYETILKRFTRILCARMGKHQQSLLNQINHYDNALRHLGKVGIQ